MTVATPIPESAATDPELLTAEALVERVVREAAGAPICLTSSFQTEDMVALHMLRRLLPDFYKSDDDDPLAESTDEARADIILDEVLAAAS